MATSLKRKPIKIYSLEDFKVSGGSRNYIECVLDDDLYLTTDFKVKTSKESTNTSFGEFYYSTAGAAAIMLATFVSEYVKIGKDFVKCPELIRQLKKKEQSQ